MKKESEVVEVVWSVKCGGRKWKEWNWVLMKGGEGEGSVAKNGPSYHLILSHFFSFLTVKVRKESVAFNSLCPPQTSVHCKYWKLLSCREMKVHLGRLWPYWSCRIQPFSQEWEAVLPRGEQIAEHGEFRFKAPNCIDHHILICHIT